MKTGGPITLAAPARFPATPPAQADVVIIGGGIAGVMTALYLAEAGQRVTLCEKGRIAGEQSSRNWGWVRQQGRDPGELPIMVEALRLWQGLDQRLGEAVSLRRTGTTYLAASEVDLASYESWLPHARAHGLDTHLLGRAELDQILPNAAGWVGALTTPSDARAEPWSAVPAIAGLAADAGVTICEDCAVRGVETSGGRISGVVTEKGRIAAPLVLLAGGAWSSLFAGNAGLWFPQLSVRATVAATEEMPDFHAGNAADAGFAFRRRADGGYTLAPGIGHDFWIGPAAFRNLRAFLPQIRRDLSHTRLSPAAPKGFPDAWGTARRWGPDDVSPFERMRVLDPAPNMARIERLRSDFASAFPKLGKPGIARAWAGMIDVTPDQVPILDQSRIPGFFIATGLSGHGFGIGPGIGRVMADLMLGKPVGHDLTRFRFARFSDGSKIELGPSI
ncbi:NAD(P)/FAD-dependent oxidoreductase [Paracoccus litorisediminis]|uniref:FAD-dependent oxidoreductase n=1 Tax=Paracoccus litorisediminis TaxID=2006130 RepID=A0A844HKN2_9RHOB|nr:FAD-binding oxidoreductase [Paracoccus litorisediminis]MTH58341.1 FAD-dependent oxidoreductase [Paracoccus litorisediminis]